MSKKKLVGIITACAVAIIVAIVLFSVKPWEEAPSIETHTLTTSVSPSGAGTVSPSGGVYERWLQLRLIALPTCGYVFDHWSGNASGNSTAISIDMNQDYSMIANFVPAVPTALEPLEVVAPPYGATGVPYKNTVFSWTGINGADTHDFVLSANPDFSTPVEEMAGLTTTACAVTVTLQYRTVYYWQVKAFKEGSVIGESPVAVFLTTQPTPAPY